MESQWLTRSQTFGGFTESQIRGKRKRISHLFGQTSKGQPCPVLAWIRAGGYVLGERKSEEQGSSDRGGGTMEFDGPERKYGCTKGWKRMEVASRLPQGELMNRLVSSLLHCSVHRAGKQSYNNVVSRFILLISLSVLVCASPFRAFNRWAFHEPR